MFRDQEFSADHGSRAVRRIAEVRTLRAAQFPEDDGPLAHPVRPDSYIRIDNFYTPTVYNKGAELVRMIHTLTGKAGFRRGMDLYIRRHDNHAATIEDFVAAMQEASGVDLGRFKRWYEQAGTPEVSVEDRWDPADTSYELTAEQRVPPTPGQPVKEPMLIPLAIGLLDPGGAELPMRLDGEATGGTGNPRPAVNRGAAELQVCRCAGAAGALAAARLFGAGQAQGHLARPAQIPCGPRHRAFRPLGSRPTGRRQAAARPDRRRPARRPPCPARSRPRCGAAAHPRRCRARSRLCSRGVDLAERGVSRRPARRGRCRCYPPCARGCPSGPRASIDGRARSGLFEIRGYRPIPDRRRLDRPAGLAQRLPRLSRRRRSRAGRGAGDGAVRGRAQHDRCARSADSARRSRSARARDRA